MSPRFGDPANLSVHHVLARNIGTQFSNLFTSIRLEHLCRPLVNPHQLVSWRSRARKRAVPNSGADFKELYQSILWFNGQEIVTTVLDNGSRSASIRAWRSSSLHFRTMERVLKFTR